MYSNLLVVVPVALQTIFSRYTSSKKEVENVFQCDYVKNTFFLSSVVLKTDTGFNKSFTTVNKSDAHLFRINSTRVLRNWHSNILFYYVVGLLPSTTFIIVFFLLRYKRN